MLILASATDKLQLVTGGASNINVHASWLDNVAGAVGPGRTNTTITTGTTTDIVGSPAAGVFRNIKTLHIHNSASAPIAITVRHTDGTTIVDLWGGTLQIGETLQYIDEIGFKLIGATGDDVSDTVIQLKSIVPTAVALIEIGSEILTDPRFKLFELIFNVKHNNPTSDQGLIARVSTDGTSYIATPGQYLQSGWVSASVGSVNQFVPSQSQTYAFLCNGQAVAQEGVGRVTIYPGAADSHIRLKAQSSTWTPGLGSFSLYLDTMMLLSGSLKKLALLWTDQVSTFTAGFGFIKLYGIR